MFYQLFSVLGAVHQVGVNRKPQVVGLPFVHALLKNKKQGAYTKVMKIILKAGHEHGFRVPDDLQIMSDFEYGIINSVTDIFGPDKIRCCFFHLCQNVYRHVVEEGLAMAYKGEDRTVKKSVHALCALAFVPADRVVEHFQTLRDILPEELQGVVDYFEVNYIRRLKMRRKKTGGGVTVVKCRPRYPPELWNQYNAVVTGQSRTNNVSEGWHSRFQLVVGKHHPSMYAFFEELQKEQADTEIMLRQLQLGQRIRKVVDKSRRRKEEMIRNVVDRYFEYVVKDDIHTYLNTIGYHVKFR